MNEDVVLIFVLSCVIYLFFLRLELLNAVLNLDGRKKKNEGIASKEKERIFAHELQNGGCSSVG